MSGRLKTVEGQFSLFEETPPSLRAMPQPSFWIPVLCHNHAITDDNLRRAIICAPDEAERKHLTLARKALSRGATRKNICDGTFLADFDANKETI
jgi:hypothetical protein